MSHFEIGGGDYDDLMAPSIGGDVMTDTNQSSYINTVKNSPGEKPKQESVTVWEEVPLSVRNHVKSVSYPPTKQTRFSLATPELEHELEKRIKEIIPCAHIDFKPNKAEVADATIIEGNKEKQGNKCDLPNRRIGCMNFIHQDRPKEGSTSKKYIEIMFFNFDKKEEYERIKPAVVEFFKEMNTDTNIQNTYKNTLQNDIPVRSMNQSIMGGRHLKKTHKKKHRSNKKHRSKSKRRLRK